MEEKYGKLSPGKTKRKKIGAILSASFYRNTRKAEVDTNWRKFVHDDWWITDLTGVISHDWQQATCH